MPYLMSLVKFEYLSFFFFFFLMYEEGCVCVYVTVASTCHIVCRGKNTSFDVNPCFPSHLSPCLWDCCLNKAIWPGLGYFLPPPRPLSLELQKYIATISMPGLSLDSGDLNSSLHSCTSINIPPLCPFLMSCLHSSFRSILLPKEAI